MAGFRQKALGLKKFHATGTIFFGGHNVEYCKILLVLAILTKIFENRRIFGVLGTTRLAN